MKKKNWIHYIDNDELDQKLFKLLLPLIISLNYQKGGRHFCAKRAVSRISSSHAKILCHFFLSQTIQKEGFSKLGPPFAFKSLFAKLLTF